MSQSRCVTIDLHLYRSFTAAKCGTRFPAHEYGSVVPYSCAVHLVPYVGAVKVIIMIFVKDPHAVTCLYVTFRPQDGFVEAGPD